MLFLSIMISLWGLIPFGNYVVSSPDLGILLFLALSSFAVYGVLVGGWASNSRYAFLGSIRSASQMLSYELILGLLILFVCVQAKSFNFIDVANAQKYTWFILPLAPIFVVYITTILAETNRTPFDLPEAESELVSGYSVEYASLPFAFYFIAEYGALIVWAHVSTILFLGGWNSFVYLPYLPFILTFELKALFILFLFCWIRATLPRYRWDQLMELAWRYFLPIVLFGIFLIYGSLHISLQTTLYTLSFFLPLIYFLIIKAIIKYTLIYLLYRFLPLNYKEKLKKKIQKTIKKIPNYEIPSGIIS